MHTEKNPPFHAIDRLTVVFTHRDKDVFKLTEVEVDSMKTSGTRFLRQQICEWKRSNICLPVVPKDRPVQVHWCSGYL